MNFKCKKLHSNFFMQEFKFEEHDFDGKIICIYGERFSGKTSMVKNLLIKKSNNQRVSIINPTETTKPEYTNFLQNIEVYDSYNYNIGNPDFFQKECDHSKH